MSSALALDQPRYGPLLHGKELFVSDYIVLHLSPSNPPNPLKTRKKTIASAVQAEYVFTSYVTDLASTSIPHRTLGQKKGGCGARKRELCTTQDTT